MEAKVLSILFTTCEGTPTGATQSTFYLADGLAKRGHRILVACPEESLLYRMLEDSPAKRVAVGFRGKFDIKSLNAIRKIVIENRISIINAQSSADRYTSIFARWLCPDHPKVVHTRRQRPLSGGGSLQRAFYVRNTARIVVVSRTLKQTFVTTGYPEAHIEVIFNGMDPSFFKTADTTRTDELRRSFNISTGEVVIGCISRMKEQAQIIKACRFLPKEFTLFFAGIDNGSLDKVVREERIQNRIIYAGLIPRDEIANYYRLFDVFVLPSTMDGFGLVLVEAMGLGVPVIGTRSQGIIDVLDNEKNGLWFEDGDIEELAVKISILIQNKDLRAEKIANGLVAAHQVFTIEKTIDNWENFFMSI